VVALAASAALFGTGCAEKKVEQKSVQVSGKVNIDSKPLAEGEVTFVGDPGSIPEVIPIKNGVFDGTVKPGKKKVEIRAFRIEKPPPTATGFVTDSHVNYIPERFNAKTTLLAEVTESGISPNVFDVKSQ
jgi:hypothetical protein